MPDQPVSEAVQPGSEVGPPGVGVAVVGWRWMGSTGPLFLRVAGTGLAPGDRLPGERELCELLGVSRASVREALRSLQTRGIVAVQHGKGVFVTAPDEGERTLQHFARLQEVGLDELFAMREVLEVPAAGWAAMAASDEQIANLGAVYDDLERAVLAGRPPQELQAIDARLHLTIAEYANNRFLAMTQEVLQEMLARSMETTLSIAGRAASSLREHADIVAALAARSPGRAQAAGRRHIHSARRAAIGRIEREQAVITAHSSAQ